MARQGWGRHSTVATGTDSGDQVSVNAWNADVDKDGMLGFNGETIASATSITPANSTIILSGSTAVSTIAVTNTSEYDLIYVFTSGTATLTNTSSPASSGDIRLLADANKTLSTTVTTILIRKGTAWYEYGGGITNALNDVGDVTITSNSAGELLKWDGSAWINNTLAQVGAQSTLTFGIANTNAVQIDSATATSGEYAKLTASGVESKSFAEVKTDLSLGNVEDTALSTWAGTSNITTLGTVTTGTWSGTAVGETKGGTNQTTYTTGDILYASGANTLTKLGVGSNGEVLTLASGVPSWAAAAGGGATIVHAFTNTTTTTYTGTASSFGTVGVGDRDIYIKKIDANNEGVFTKIWKNGSAVEVQIA